MAKFHQIRNKTDDDCKNAVIQDGLQLIDVPTKMQTLEICKLALAQNWKAMCFVKTPTQDLCDYAVSVNPLALQFIMPMFQTKELCLDAIRQNGYAINYINYKTEELVKLSKESQWIEEQI